jgi:hypothetical protein
MRPLLIQAFLLASAIHATPVADSSTMSRKLDLGLMVDDLGARLVQAERLVAQARGEVLSAENNTASKWDRKASMRIAVADSLFEGLRDSLSALGSVTEYQLEVVNTRDEIEKLALEVQFRKSQRETYAKELPTIDRAREAEVYHQTWEKSREIDETIFGLEQKLLLARQQVRQNIIDLDLREASEPPSETSRAWVEFTNMPGGEFSYLSIENPKVGRSASAYMGGSVRYLFTRGKSYVVLGILKADGGPTSEDTTMFTDVFHYAYGADFYPSHFGRGQRNFLNLYSGFTLGGLFLSSKSDNTHLFQVTPHVGIELFKGKQFLLDTRAGYLLPFSSTYNLNLRGWTSSTSLNFVF